MTSAVSLMVNPPKNRSSTTRACRGSILSSSFKASSSAVNSAVRPFETLLAFSRETWMAPPPHFASEPPASVVDKNAAHHLSSDPIKVRPALPANVLTDKSQIRLVYKGSRLQCVTGPFTAYVMVSETAAARSG